VQNGGAELTHEIIEDLGHAPPNQVTACIVGEGTCVGASTHRHLIAWVDSNLDSPDGFTVYRTRGATVDGTSVITKLTPAALPAGATSYEDPEELPNGLPFTYWTKAVFLGTETGPSVQAHIAAAINAAPVAVEDLFLSGGSPTVSGNVFTNDTDADMGPTGTAGWRALLVNASGTPVAPPPGLTFRADGSFTRISNGAQLVFYYRIDTGTWTDGVFTADMSPDSNVAKVTVR
jgi:hypothetical protein